MKEEINKAGMCPLGIVVKQRRLDNGDVTVTYTLNNPNELIPHDMFLYALSKDEAVDTGYITNKVIRDVFMKNGFTIKEGQDDLNPYVYRAARDLLALVVQHVPSKLDHDEALSKQIVEEKDIPEGTLSLLMEWFTSGWNAYHCYYKTKALITNVSDEEVEKRTAYLKQTLKEACLSIEHVSGFFEVSIEPMDGYEEMSLLDIYIKTIEQHKEKDTFNLTELRKAFGDINHRLHMGVVSTQFTLSCTNVFTSYGFVPIKFYVKVDE